MLGLKKYITNEILPPIYKKLFKLILPFTKPIILTKNGESVISTMTYHRYVDIMIFSLKTFFNLTKLKLPLYVFDDGSLTKKDYVKIKRHLLNVHLLQKKATDIKIRKILKPYKYSSKFRFDNFEFKFNLKLFDPFLLPRYKKVIYIDHDIIFLNQPNELIEWIKSETNICLYATEFLYQKNTPEELTEPWQIIEKLFFDKFNMKFPRLFNSGLVCINKHNYSLKKIERVVAYLYKVGLEKTWSPEQYSLAYLLSQNKTINIAEKGYLNLTRKDLSLISNPFSYKSIHFANLARQHYYRIAILLILKNKFRNFF